MHYRQIVQLIRNACDSYTFVHGKNADKSIASIDATFPFIHLMPIRTQVNRIENYNTHSCVLFFLMQDAPDTTPMERELIISQMDLLSEYVLFTLSENPSIKIESELKTPEYQQLAGTVSGYGVAFNIISRTQC